MTGLATELPVNLKVGGPLRLEGFDSRVVKVSLGAKHSAALTEKGTVYTWGIGPGIGIDPASSMPYHATPVSVLLPAAATDIAVGDGFTVICGKDGKAYMWGDLAENEDWKPKAVTFLGTAAIRVVAAAAGDRHAVVLTDAGLVYTWGSNEYGELGNGPVDKEMKKAPVKLPLTDVVVIKSFKNSSFAITSKGDVYAWGSNVWGHLGLGHINAVSQPTLVSGLSRSEANGAVQKDPGREGGGVKVVDVVSGFNHTLFRVVPRASTTAVTPIVLGFSGEPQPYPLPAPPSVDLPKGQLWTTGSIAATGCEPSDEVVIWRPSPQWAGKSVVSGATTTRMGWNVLSDGVMFAWGNGNLGTGEDSQSAATPMRLWDLDAVHAGPTGDWAMAVTDKGKVFAWGEGQDFRTGLGGISRSQFPRMVEFPSPVKGIALGYSHGIAVTEDYGVFTWGTGKGLGTGGRTKVERAPKRIQGAETLGVCNVTAGRGFSTILTLSGEVYSWGDPTDGKLGHEDGTEKLSPTLMDSFPDDLKVVHVVSGLQFSLALLEDGSVYSWGHGADGCLGLGPKDLSTKTLPTKIPFFENAGRMAYLITSANSVFAISSTGGLYAWGAPHLGVGTGRTLATPTRVAALQKCNVLGVAPGEWQSLAWMGTLMTPPPLAPGLAPAWGPVPTEEVHEDGEEAMPAIEVTLIPESSGSAPGSAKNSPKPDRPASGRLHLKHDPKRHSVGPPPPDPVYPSFLLEFLKKFFSDEPELDRLAQLGNVDEVRKFLDTKGHDPNHAHAEAIKQCCKQIKKDETFIKGWPIYAINKQDFESERILIITDKAHYKCKYDFKKQSIVHTKRYAAMSLYQVLCGKFKDVSKVSQKVRGDVYEKQYGIQVWFSDPSEWKPPNVLLPFQKIRVPYTIFRPFMSAEATLLQQERVCHEICLALEATVHWYRNGSHPIEYMHEFIVEAPKRFDGYPTFPARKVAFIPRAPLTLSSGLLSVAHNKWLTPKK